MKTSPLLFFGFAQKCRTTFVLSLLWGILFHLTSCSNKEDFLNPSSAHIFLTNSSKNIIVTDIKATTDGGFLVFGVASQTLNERFDGTAQLYLMKIDENGKSLKDTLLSDLPLGFSSNILEDNGSFECIWSPSTTKNNPHYFLRISSEADKIMVVEDTFSLECRLSDCGNITQITRRTNGKYITLNVGLDDIGSKNFSKFYIHQLDINNLTSQEQIAEEEFTPESFGGFKGNNLSLLRSVYDFLFISILDQDGVPRLFYSAPSKDKIALKYVGEQNAIYNDEKYWLSGIYKQSISGNYSFVIRNKEVATSTAYWQSEFRLLTQNWSFQNVSNSLKLEQLNSTLKTVIRENDNNELFIGGTTLSGKSIIFYNKEKFEFGGSTNQYELGDFLIKNNNVLITGTTILRLSDESLNGKRVPFLIIVPESEFRK